MKKRINSYQAVASFVRGFFEAYARGIIDAVIEGNDFEKKNDPKEIKQMMLEHYGEVNQYYFDIMFSTLVRLNYKTAEEANERMHKNFDHSGNAFVSAFREYTDKNHTEVGIHIEYLATPEIDDKTLIIADPMLATGGSMELGLKAILTKGSPKHIHVACVLATPEGIEHIKNTFPDDKTTIWCAAIDEGLNEHKYIVPGFGDAGDLCYGGKL